jgi:uncharacterized protein YukE
MGMLSALISDVEDVIDKVTKQVGDATDMKGVLDSALQPIMEGAWVGKGSTVFQGVMEEQVMTAIQNVIESITGLGSDIKDALEIIKEADALMSLLDPIGDAVSAIGDALGL